jgi:hypothetical protein
MGRVGLELEIRLKPIHLANILAVFDPRAHRLIDSLGHRNPVSAGQPRLDELNPLRSAISDIQ